MTLRSKFILLVLGSLFFPVLAMLGSYFLLQGLVNLDDPAMTTREFQKELEQVERAEDITSLVEEFGDSYFSITIDESELIDSSRDIFTDTVDGPEAEAFSPQIIVQRFYHTLKDGQQVVVYFGIDFFETKRLFFPLVFLVSSLLILSVLSIFIIRSINRSIGGLEQATRHIAEGNLDVEIDILGQDTFGSLARSLDTMRDQIKTEYDRRNRFFMGVSHDLKTPLASITGYSDALLEGMAEDRESIDKYLSIINEKSHQLERGITRLIHYLKLSNYDFQASLEEKFLVRFLSSFLEVQQEEAGFHGDSLEGRIDISEDILVAVDEDLMRRALENLIQNAYRYGAEHETVRFHCHKEYGKIVMAVENKGRKIPEDQLDYLFEPFFRGDNSRRGDGFGLGLASVKSIVESHGWSISVESTEKLTRFAIVIPTGKHWEIE